MNEPKQVDFQPRWMRSAIAEQISALADTPFTGQQALAYPRIVTRILPFGGTVEIPARALAAIIDHTQTIASYATYDVVERATPTMHARARLASPISVGAVFSILGSTRPLRTLNSAGDNGTYVFSLEKPG